MPISITSTVIRHDGRAPGKPGLVLGWFEYDDGVGEPCTIFAEATQDALAWMQEQIPAREAGRKDAELRRAVEDASALGASASIPLKSVTIAEVTKAVVDALPGLTRERAIMAKDFLAARSDDDLAAALKTTKDGVTDLRETKLTEAAALAETIRTSTGD